MNRLKSAIKKTIPILLFLTSLHSFGQEVKDQEKKVTVTSNEKKDGYTENHSSFNILLGISGVLFAPANLMHFEPEHKNSLGPIIVRIEKGFSKKISIAYQAGAMWYYAVRKIPTSAYSNDYMEYGGIYAAINLQANYHLGHNPIFDPYVYASGGIGTSVAKTGYDHSLTEELKNPLPIMYGIGMGAKLYIQSKNALIIEAGYDNFSYIKIGYSITRRK